jgi:hypothetical protein
MPRVPLESTLLASAQYHATRRVLDVEFHSGELYRYFGVSKTHYQGLLRAESKGRYFNQNIRNRFSYHNLSRPAPVVLAAAKTK